MSGGERKTAPRHQAASAGAENAGSREYLARQPSVAGLAAWEWDLETGACLFTPEWEHMLQHRDANPLALHDPDWWRERVHEEDAAEVRQAVHALLEGRSVALDVVFRIRRDDGCWAWLLSRGAVVAQQDGRPLRVHGVVVDISHLRADPKFQMGAIGVGDATYHAMLENSPDMYVRMDRELFPAYINPQVIRYMDRDRDEFTYSDTLEELKVSPEQLEFLQRNVRRVFDEGVALREKVSFVTAYGHEVSGEYSFWPEFDADGNVVFAMTQFRDLSEQVAAERRAALNEQRLTALYQLTQMDNVPESEVLNFVLDSLLKLTRSSSGFIFFPKDGDVGGKGSMLWSADHHGRFDPSHLPIDRFPEDLICLTTETDGNINYRSVRNGDGVNPVHVSFDGAMPVMRSMIAPGTEGDRIVCVAGVCNKESEYEDADLQQLETFINGAWLVLGRQRFMRELQRAKEAAERANRIKDEFLANVSHELRTPLNGILSMLQLLELLPLTSQQQEYVRAASVSGKTLLRIISDILDFSRMESGLMELRPESFDVKAAVRSTLQLFHTEAKKKDLRTSFLVDERIPPRLFGDEARVRQILFNLVGNAIKFTEKGSVAVECSLQPGTEETGAARIHIVVRDTGIGIPREKLGIVFDAFTQVDSSSTRKYAGTGLGLGIVKRLVEMMGGAVSLESEVGRGTSVYCQLSLALPSARAEEAHRPAALAADGDTAPLDILVAEDDEVSRFAIRSFLQRAGHRPLCVSDGMQALEALRLHRFDCLFTDIQMPGMDGLEVASRIRANNMRGVLPSPRVRNLVAEQYPGAGRRSQEIDPAMFIVAVSAHAMMGDKERFLFQGMDDYISKPIDMGQLLALLGRVRRKKAGARMPGEEASPV